VSHGIYAALSGAIAQQSSLDSIAGNLANANTTGYRAVRPVFHEVLRGKTKQGDGASFSAINRTAIDTQLGDRERTDRPLDIALPENAFLAVRTERGERYTRAGDLQISPDGQLVTRQGHPLLDETLDVVNLGPDADVSIGTDGAIQVDGYPMGHLRLVEFADPTQLTYEGAVLLAGSPGSGPATPTKATLAVGELESSNASPVRAMTDLMQATRMFEAMETAIGSFKDIDERLVTTVPK